MLRVCYKRCAYALLYIMICLVVCTLCITAPAYAQARGTGRQGVAASGHVTVIILDMSASMEQNDAPGLRCSAAKAYIDLSTPDDRIGLVDLDNHTGLTEKSHGFLQALTWSPPVQVSDPTTLQNIIDQQAPGCQADPGGSTPTYDALNSALTMLSQATQQEQQPGSAILLTDGTPYPDTQAQIDAIETGLVPQFKAHGWPVYTIALGSHLQQPFLDFMNYVSNATAGHVYDDDRGVVPGSVSPLNVASFFADIYARQTQRTLRLKLGPQSLHGDTTSQPFIIDNYTKSLDILVIRDSDAQTSMPVTLKTANGLTLPSNQALENVRYNVKDPYYAFFSILSDPQPGQWFLNISGSGQFLLYSLVVSDLAVSILSPAEHGPVQPLGQNLLIRATVDDQGQPVLDGRYTLTAIIAYIGEKEPGTVPFMKREPLSPTGRAGIYETSIPVPLTASPGAYDITVSASEVSGAVISSSRHTIIMAPLPQPAIDGQNVAVIHWSPALLFLYTVAAAPLHWLNEHFLQQPIPQPSAMLSGVIEPGQALYVRASIARAAMTRADAGPVMTMAVINEAGGRFHLIVQPQASGVYTITLTEQGTLRNNLGSFDSPSTFTMQLLSRSPTLWEQGYAWLLVVILIMGCAAVLLYLCRFCLVPFPSGAWLRGEQGAGISGPQTPHPFRHGWRLLLKLFLRRNLLLSKQTGMPAGLQFRFRRRHVIEVRAYGREAADWTLEQGGAIPTRFGPVGKKLVYHPGRGSGNVYHPVHFTILSQWKG
jgi:hypothetical protein